MIERDEIGDILEEVKLTLPSLADLYYTQESTRRMTSSNRSLSLILLEVPADYSAYGVFREHDTLKIKSWAERGKDADLVALTLTHLRAVELPELAELTYQRLGIGIFSENKYKGFLFFPIKEKEDVNQVRIGMSPEKGVYWYMGKSGKNAIFKPLISYYKINYPLSNSVGKA